MAVNWTEKQLLAINTTGSNLIVGAAAGSGKTAVLVERIIKKIINDKIDITSLLITTFTEAAASKMKADIKDEIEKRLSLDPENAHLARQAVLVNKADISTIHSFCTRVIRHCFNEADVDPDFGVCDENEAKLLFDKAIDEVFLEMYDSDDEGFYELLDCYAGQRGDDNLKEIVTTIYGFLKAMPYYEEWADKAARAYSLDGGIENSKLYKVILGNFNRGIDENLHNLRIARELAGEVAEFSKYADALSEDVTTFEVLNKRAKTSSLEEISALVSAISFKSPSAKNGIDDNLKDYLKSVRENAKNFIAEFKEDFFEGLEEKCALVKSSEKRVRALFDLTKKTDERFSELKRKRSLLDFSDLEHFCLKVLVTKDEKGNKIPTPQAEEIKKKYVEILVDEYQDANEMQEEIFSLISKGDNLFMVGDLKQSIYKFRHTNPYIFKKKMKTFSETDGINRKVVMKENFRSRKTVIDLVNFIFEQVCSEAAGEVTYNEDERLNFSAIYPKEEVNTGGKCELILIDAPEKDDDELYGFEAEAFAVAEKIKELFKTGYMVFDKKEGYRPIKLSDIVILMQSPNVDAKLVSDVLESSDIDCFLDVGGGYFQTEEIMVIMNILTVIDNPHQDIPVLAALRSPVFSFDENDLVKIRINSPETDFFDAVFSYSEAGDDAPLKDKTKGFLKKLSSWREMAEYMPAFELIENILTETGYFSYAGSMPSGEIRKENLRLLIKRAEMYEKTSYKGLFNFIKFVEKMSKRKKDSKSARLLGENQDVVRIMSIHKSKGLEFPVVFLMGLNKKFNTKDLSGSVILHKELGIGIDYVDTLYRFKMPLITKKAIASAILSELVSEQMRLLYVALTRAREKLFMTAFSSNMDKALGKWEQTASEAEGLNLPEYRMTSARCFADWVVPAIMRSPQGRCLTRGLISQTGKEIELKVTKTSYKNEPFSVKNKEDATLTETEEKIKEILLFEYKDKDGSRIPSKLSVTELKRLINSSLDGENYITKEIKLEKVPEFLKEDKPLSATEAGSVTHFIMQNISLLKKPEESDVQSLSDELYKKGLLTEKQKNAVDAKKIVSFFESDLGKRLLLSKDVQREIPFEIKILANEIYKTKSDEGILVQGIIDCVFSEGEKTVLIDYKTDSLKNTTEEELAEKYRVQLEVYERALKTFKKTETEKYIYFFSSGKYVKLGGMESEK